MNEKKIDRIGKAKMGNVSVGVYRVTDLSQETDMATSNVTANVKRYYGQM